MKYRYKCQKHYGMKHTVHVHVCVPGLVFSWLVMDLACCIVHLLLSRSFF